MVPEADFYKWKQGGVQFYTEISTNSFNKRMIRTLLNFNIP